LLTWWRAGRDCRHAPFSPLRSLPQRIGALSGAVGEALAVLVPFLADGVRRGLRGGLRDFLAALQRLLAGLLGLLLDAIGHRTELLVLNARARHEQAREEA